MFGSQTCPVWESWADCESSKDLSVCIKQLEQLLNEFPTACWSEADSQLVEEHPRVKFDSPSATAISRVQDWLAKRERRKKYFPFDFPLAKEKGEKLFFPHHQIGAEKKVKFLIFPLQKKGKQFSSGWGQKQCFWSTHFKRERRKKLFLSFFLCILKWHLGKRQRENHLAFCSHSSTLPAKFAAYQQVWDSAKLPGWVDQKNQASSCFLQSVES